MKKVLLSGAAAAALAFASTPAMAGDGVIDLELGGFFKGYGVYVDHDTNFGGAAGLGDNLRSFDLRRSGLISFSGETTLDNGLTVGAVIEMETEDSANNNGSIGHTPNDNQFEESYIYFSGGWGRFNFGNEDSAGYLLQVAAPSADDNIDGVRQNINAFDYNGNAATEAFRMDYDMDQTWGEEKITYLTPKFNGFQAGVSFTPDLNPFDGVDAAVTGVETDNDAGDFENAFDLAARWDGEFEDVTVALGAGYSHASTETDAAGVAAVGTDDWTQWNAALDLGWQNFGLGFAYMHNNNGIAQNGDTRVWVVGVDWDNGPYHLGLSYMDREDEANYATVLGGGLGGNDVDHTRITGGGAYQYGPGMSFRGSVSWVNQDETGSTDEDAWQVAIGTDITF